MFFTLFADDHRAENFRSMDEIFPSRDILAGDDEVVTYVPGLAGSGYDGVTVRQLLTMSSGVDFDEGYDSTFVDVNMVFLRSMALGEPMLDDYAGLERIREPGVYNDDISSDSGVLAATVAAAIGRPIADYVQEQLWQPAGMEGDAFWSTDRTDVEIGFCCLNAQLRDYARFGRLYLQDGSPDGRQVLPADWVEASTQPEASHLDPGDNLDASWTFGYGYNW